jgi:hypothetical protein
MNNVVAVSIAASGDASLNPGPSCAARWVQPAANAVCGWLNGLESIACLASG